MRKIKILIVMLMLLASVVSYAGVKPDIAFLKNSHIVKVVYAADQSSTAHISILNGEGEEVFSEYIRDRKKFIRPYNFSHLPEGNYSIVVESLDETVKENFDYKKKELLSDVRKIEDQSERKYLFTISNEDKSKMTIEIMDADSRVLYKNSMKITDDYGCVFNIKNVNPTEGLIFHVQKGDQDKYIRVQ